jgi:hypothetical protein
LLSLWLTGEVEFETSDGDIRRPPAGSVVLAEDTTGKGHISRHPPEGQLVVHVALADQKLSLVVTPDFLPEFGGSLHFITAMQIDLRLSDSLLSSNC